MIWLVNWDTAQVKKSEREHNGSVYQEHGKPAQKRSPLGYISEILEKDQEEEWREMIKLVAMK